MKTEELIERLKEKCPREEDYLDGRAYVLHKIIEDKNNAEFWKNRLEGEISGMLASLLYRGVINVTDKIRLQNYYSKERYAE